MSKVIFIVGPTATGKSEVAFLLAKALEAQIISCDSMLIYKEPQIITAKPGPDILREVKHHFIGTISVRDSYNVFDYYSQASQKIIELYKKGVRPIVCGGSGLYMKALCDGIFQEPLKDDSLRKELELKAEKKGLASLYQKLEAVDPQAAKKISPADARRIIRALEVYHASGIPISQKQKQARGLCAEFGVRIFGLNLERGVLYERINKRTDEMFEKGAIEEVKQLLAMPLSITAQKIIGIKEIADFLTGKIYEQEARELMKKNTRNFAKRQITWFKKDKRIEWIDIGSLASKDIKEEIIGKIKNE